MGIYTNKYIPTVFKNIRADKNEVGWTLRSIDNEGKILYRNNDYIFIYNDASEIALSEIGQVSLIRDSSFITVNTESILPNERRLTAGDNITITDGGSGSNITIAAAQPVSSVNGHIGNVLLDPDDLSDTTTTNKFVSAAQISYFHTHSNKAQLDGIDQNLSTTSAVTFSTVDGRDVSVDGSKLDGIAAGAQVNTVASVNGATGTVVLDPDDLSDTGTTNKFVSQAEKDNFHTHSNKANLDEINQDLATTDSVEFVNIVGTGQAVAGDHTQTFSATPVFDFNNGNTQEITLTADITSWTINNELDAGSYVIYFIQDGVGGRSISSPTGIDKESDNSIADFITSAGDINVVNIIVMPNSTSIWSLVDTITA